MRIAFIGGGHMTTSLVGGRRARGAAAEGVSEEAARATLLGKQPTGRFVGESDVGALIAFLCSDAADQIRGAAMSIDGGWCAQ